MARPRGKFNWEVFDALCQFKVSKAFCADYMGCSEDTIERRLKSKHKMTFTEYKDLKSQGVALKLQQKAINMALQDGNTTMMIFCLKNMANWSDKVEQKVTEGQINITYEKAKKK